MNDERIFALIPVLAMSVIASALLIWPEINLLSIVIDITSFALLVLLIFLIPLAGIFFVAAVVVLFIDMLKPAQKSKAFRGNDAK